MTSPCKTEDGLLDFSYDIGLARLQRNQSLITGVGDSDNLHALGQVGRVGLHEPRLQSRRWWTARIVGRADGVEFD